MKSRYEKEYDNLLQALRDKEDEAAQKERKAEKARMQKLRDLSRLLEATIKLYESGVPRSVIVSIWKGSPVLEPVADFLFPKSK
jgi:uncharacterized protein involved in exopolysaccharide biosynthesis